ncbi:MAG: hypothetical protein HY000_23565 [Planctomycetes bacterium]|nr:hypothetical protein [Planctomycetota bacterium]
MLFPILFAQFVVGLGSTKLSAQESDKDALLRRALERLDKSESQVNELRQRVDDLTRQLHARDASQADLGKNQDRLDTLIQAYMTREPERSISPAAREATFDQAKTEAGRAAFETSCTKCHDAERALQKSKDLAGWRSTVRRMARKTDANVPGSVWEPIAQYLASQSAGQAPSTGEPAGALKEVPGSKFLGGQFDFSMTLAPVWRGGAREDRLENPGFFPDTWVGAEWHSDKAISARVTACVTCHKEGTVQDRVALAEAAVRFDFDRWLGRSDDGPKAAVEAGRFIVPFGLSALHANPGAFRTVTKPLMYNMGQNVDRPDIGNAVLPMPYSDEGVLFKFAMPVACDLTAAIDFYLVNGLVGDEDGVDFYRSREYFDNNAEPAVGARFSIGNQFVQLGSSIMGGQFNRHSDEHEMGYELVGADLTVRYQDQLRVNFEYALRNSDVVSGSVIEDEEVSGFNVEAEWRLCSSPRVGLVARYDTLAHNGSALPDPDFTVHRFTWGFTITLPGGSLLLINHEHWNMPQNLNGVDVLGLRWVATF